MKRWFLVTGMKPAYGKAVNDFVKACDLGVEGAYYQSHEVVTVTVGENVTPEQMERQPTAIKAAFEHIGWYDVGIIEYTDKKEE